jgi:2-polyprenyl-3-methyl-5-hydroxy-6-metoxy-1,4-benzoquinol methylase
MKDVTQENRKGWSQFAYEAWTKGKGTPEEYALELMKDPWNKLKPFHPYLKELEGKRVANLLGSNGRIAIPLALLGADVTVVDISKENARYGMELAEAADVKIDYIISDVMSIPEEKQITNMDIVLMELGILHWIMDIKRFFKIVASMIKDDGRLILRDFHPIKRGLLRWDGREMVASGDYFDSSVHEGEVPYRVFLNNEEQNTLSKVYTRGWTMGDIVTAISEAGLIIKVLDEERGGIQRWVFPEDAPVGIEDRIPGIYTLVADRG